jgi:hypothetical protein
MSEELTNKIVAWANEIASYAAQLPSRQAREEYLAERRRELVAGAQAEGVAPRDAAILADACVRLNALACRTDARSPSRYKR